MGNVACRIWAVQGNLGPLGGPAEVFNVPLWDGRLVARNCNGKLKTKSSGGIGVSWHRIRASDDFDCDANCEFKVGDTVSLNIITFLLVTITTIDMSLCDSGSDWHIGLGLGLGWNGAVWEVDRVD